MSYILNALRKSEQERRNDSAPSLKQGLLQNHNAQQSRKSSLIIGLLILNLIVLALFFQFNRQPIEAVAPTTAEPANAVPSAPPSIVAEAPEQPAVEIAKPVTEVEKTRPLPQSISIADIVDTRKSDINKRQPGSLNSEDKSATVMAAKPAAIATAPQQKSAGRSTVSKMTKDNGAIQQQIVGSETVINDQAVVVAPLKQSQRQNTATETAVNASVDQSKHEQAVRLRKSLSTLTASNKTQIHPPQPAPATAKPHQDTGKLPLLNELAYEFRRRVPELNINVYVYSDHPDERFIMVDMQKFTAGQQPAEGLDLKAITADSLVVEFEGKSFRIKRP